MKQQNKSVSQAEPGNGGDYLLARAKRELERLLRAEGRSIKEAKTEVHRHFTDPERKTKHGRRRHD